MLILSICIGAWFLYDSQRRSEPSPDNSEIVEEPQIPAENPQNVITNNTIKEEKKLDTEDGFELKKEAEYIQLRLSVTSQAGRKVDVEEYLSKKLDIDISEDHMGNEYIAAPRETYNTALGAIIDCPYTENVIYKNEDYYPVVCEIYANSSNEGTIPDEARSYIENIENMCKDIIILIN